MTETMAAPEENPRPKPRQARELARRLGMLTEAQAAAGWGVIVVLAALLGAIYLNQASRIATIGRRVQIEQNDLDEVKRSNAELERQIAEAQSLSRLDEEARRLGFVPSTPADIDYVVIPQYPTEPADAATIIPPTTTTEPEEPPAPPETLWQAIALAVRDLGIDLTRGETHEQ
ncbi:MAG: hypothetical protein K1X50_11515 [Candidatus Promineofilum sp.]|nr:hypothetical protein [Promineifilum sp.]MCW5862161.1 hypothetical protein [Anaerolineae bacterium]